MISRQEFEAWDVLLACQGQLRLAPSGHVIGIDMQAGLQFAAARDHDLAALSELLPAAGLVWSRRCVAIEFGMMGLDQAPGIRADYVYCHVGFGQLSPASSVLSARI